MLMVWSERGSRGQPDALQGRQGRGDGGRRGVVLLPHQRRRARDYQTTPKELFSPFDQHPVQSQHFGFVEEAGRNRSSSPPSSESIPRALCPRHLSSSSRERAARGLARCLLRWMLTALREGVISLREAFELEGKRPSSFPLRPSSRSSSAPILCSGSSSPSLTLYR